MGRIKTGFFNAYKPPGSITVLDALPPSEIAKLFGDNIKRVYAKNGADDAVGN